MALTKFINLCAIASIAILASSFGPAPANAASLGSHQYSSRSLAHQHHATQVLRKRDGKRCRPRNPPKPPAGDKPPTNDKPPTSDKPPTTTAAPAPPTSKPPSPPPSQAPKPPSNPGGGGDKIGLAWPQDDDAALRKAATGRAGFYYNWSPYCPPVLKEVGLNCMAMLWGEKQISEFQRLVKPGYAQYVLGFNEPNQEGQALMSPQRGAQLWKQYIEPLKSQGYQLISPACTNAPSGKQWMKDFLAACNGGCHLDGLAVHYYGTDPTKLEEYLKDMHETFGLDVWLTETACQNFGGGAQCNKDQVWNYMQKAKDFTLNTSWMRGIFYFGMMYNMNNVNPLNQMLAGGGPNDLGRAFIS